MLSTLSVDDFRLEGTSLICARCRVTLVDGKASTLVQHMADHHEHARVSMLSAKTLLRRVVERDSKKH